MTNVILYCMSKFHLSKMIIKNALRLQSYYMYLNNQNAKIKHHPSKLIIRVQVVYLKYLNKRNKQYKLVKVMSTDL